MVSREGDVTPPPGVGGFVGRTAMGEGVNLGVEAGCSSEGRCGGSFAADEAQAKRSLCRVLSLRTCFGDSALCLSFKAVRKTGSARRKRSMSVEEQPS